MSRTRANCSFQPVDKECAKFLLLNPPDLSNMDDLNKTIDKQIKDVNDLIFSYLQYARMVFPRMYGFELPNPVCCATGLHFYIRHKLQRLQKHYQTASESFYAKAASMASQMVFFLNDCKSYGFSATCLLDDFVMHIEEMKLKDPTIKKCLDKMKALDSYGHLSLKKTKYQMVSLPEISHFLKSHEATADASIEFSPYSVFDDYLCCFAYCSGNISLFQEFLAQSSLIKKTDITGKRQPPKLRNKPRRNTNYSILFGDDTLSSAQKSSKTDNSPLKTLEHLEASNSTMPTIELKSINTFFKSISNIIHPQSEKQSVMLRSSALRVLFDLIYITHYPSFIVQNNFEEFYKRTNIIRCLSPKELNIPLNLVMPSLFEMPFFSLETQSQYIHQAISFVTVMQFYTCPIDMIYCVLRSLKCVENFVQSCVINKKLGQFSGMIDPNQKAGMSNFISFDDLFSLFWPIITICPLSTPLSLSYILETVSGLPISSSLDFARMIFTSAISYCLEFKTSDIHDSEFSQEDPLLIG